MFISPLHDNHIFSIIASILSFSAVSSYSFVVVNETSTHVTQVEALPAELHPRPPYLPLKAVILDSTTYLLHAKTTHCAASDSTRPAGHCECFPYMTRSTRR